MSDVKFTDNSDKALDSLAEAIRKGAIAIGMTAERYVKERTPVDTGRLRNSMTFAFSGESPNISSYSGDNGEEGGTYSATAPNDKIKAVYIGTNVKYAPPVEFGSGNRRAVHMIQSGVSSHKEEYKQLMQDAMKNA